MNYSDFLKEVYGIDHFIKSGHPLASAPVLADTQVLYNSQAKLKFIILKETNSSFSAEEKDLFEKMMAALKRNLTDLSLTVTNSLKTVDPQLSSFVLMSANPQNSISLAQDLGIEISITTYDPATLLKKPELKKQVWTQIQSLK